MAKSQPPTKTRKVKAKRVGNLIYGEVQGREFIALIGRGENCTCSDCPVLYGETCPTSKPTQLPKKQKKYE